MYKLIINKVVLSILIFSLEMILYGCGDNRNETRQVPILERVSENSPYAEENFAIQNPLAEASTQKEVKKEDEKFIKGSIPKGSREVIKYLFDYIYVDQSDIIDIELYETKNELYYKYWFKSPYTDEIDEDPTFLCYFRRTSDGLYQEYVVYVEILDTYYDENGNIYKEHFRNSIGNFILVNTSTKEVIPQWLFNEDAEDDASYCVENDRYWEVINMYHEE